MGGVAAALIEVKVEFDMNIEFRSGVGDTWRETGRHVMGGLAGGA